MKLEMKDIFTMWFKCQAQLNILRRYDCEMLQGFLYSRPLNAERFEKLLSENHKLHTLLGHSNL